MKAKAILLMVLCVMGLTALTIGNAQAAWVPCTISKVGSFTNGADFIKVSALDASFTNLTFILDNSNNQARSMLAAALTAFANSTNVEVYVETPSDYGLAFGVAPIK
jgi:hypothetical protein